MGKNHTNIRIVFITIYTFLCVTDTQASTIFAASSIIFSVALHSIMVVVIEKIQQQIFLYQKNIWFDYFFLQFDWIFGKYPMTKRIVCLNSILFYSPNNFSTQWNIVISKIIFIMCTQFWFELLQSSIRCSKIYSRSTKSSYLSTEFVPADNQFFFLLIANVLCNISSTL